MRTKDLIKQLHYNADNGGISDCELERSAADALERLTQPVGVEPLPFTNAYSAETVARLQAERDEAVAALAAHKQLRSRTANSLQEQLDVSIGQTRYLMRDQEVKFSQIAALQEQVKLLRDNLACASQMLHSLGYGAVHYSEALAATEPKNVENEAKRQAMLDPGDYEFGRVSEPKEKPE